MKNEKSCKWWLKCERPATTTEPHPILGDVPICDECKAKLARISAAVRNG